MPGGQKASKVRRGWYFRPGGSDCQQSRKAGAFTPGGRQLSTDFAVFADRTGVIEAAHEPRAAVMIVVEASWQDQRGTMQAVRARMENKSVGGARIRLQTRIEMGSKVKIQWRWEQFSGVAKYCISDGMDYLVGIQRDTAKSPILNSPVSKPSLGRKRVASSDRPISTSKVRSLPKVEESKPSEIPAAEEKVEVVATASGTTAIPQLDRGHEIVNKG